MKTQTKTQKQFSWNAQYLRSQINNLKKMYSACMNVAENTTQSEEAFIANLVMEIPNTLMIMPKDIVVDMEQAKAKYILSTLSKQVPKDLYGNKVPEVFCALLFLMSKGVSSLEYVYQGGWDEVSWDEEHPDTMLHAGLPKCKDKDALVKSIYSECEQVTGVTANSILYGLLNDSGAGEGTTYSAGFRIDLVDFTLLTGEPEFDEAEEDEIDDEIS